MAAALYGDDLPRVVCGQTVRTDWRVMVEFENALFRLRDDSTDTVMRFMSRSLAAFYPARPPDRADAFKALLWFYRCGRNVPKQPRGGRAAPRGYDFEEDAALIYAAFRQAYGIDLGRAKLHWWRFRALMDNLPKDCRFCEIVGYRTIDTSGMQGETREHYEHLKAEFALPPEIGGEGLYARPLTQAEAEAAFIARLRRA